MAKGKKQVAKVIIEYIEDLILTVQLFDIRGIDVSNDTDRMFRYLFNDIDLRKTMPELWFRFLCSRSDIRVVDVFGANFDCPYYKFVRKCNAQASNLYHIIEDFERQIDEDNEIHDCFQNSDKQVA